MFAKLLKHEWRSTRPMLGILCLIALGASLLGGLTSYYLVAVDSNTGVENDTLAIISVLLMVAAMIVMALIGLAALMMYIGRFYKSRFTDEGYLTFTLPVNTHQNLLASLVNTAIGTVLMTIVICAGIALWIAIALAGFEDFYVTLWQHFPELREKAQEVLRAVWGDMPWDLVARALLNVLLGGVSQLVMLMLAVTVGSVAAKKHKILAAVGVYYGIQVLISVVSAFNLFAAGNSNSGMVMNLLDRGVALTAVLAVGGYFLMYWLVDRKLNLN